MVDWGTYRWCSFDMERIFLSCFIWYNLHIAGAYVCLFWLWFWMWRELQNRGGAWRKQSLLFFFFFCFSYFARGPVLLFCHSPFPGLKMGYWRRLYLFPFVWGSKQGTLLGR